MPHWLVHFIFKSERASDWKYNYRGCLHFCLFSLIFLPSRGKGRKQKMDILRLIIGTQGIRKVIYKVDFGHLRVVLVVFG
jgi:hypothetical protein